MRRAELTMGWLVQLIVAGALLAMLFGFASQTMTGDTFRHEVHAADAALLAETLASRSSGRAQVHTFYEDNTYALHATDEYMEVRGRTAGLGQRYPYLTPAAVSVPEALIERQAVVWTLFENTLSVSELSVEFSCPELAQPRAWEDARTAGSHAFLAKRILESAYGARGLQAQDISTDGSGQGLVFVLEQADNLTISTGQGDYNARVRCLAATRFPDARISQTDEDQDHVAVSAPEPEELEEELIALLQEAVQ